MSIRSSAQPSPLYWAILICGLAALFYGYEDTLRVLPGTLAQYLFDDLRINAQQLGVMASLFYLGYAPMQVPSGLLLDRYGPRRCLIVAALVCALATALFALTAEYWLLSTSRFFIGMASSVAYLAASLLVSRWFNARHFVLVLGLVQMIGCLGALLGQWPVAHLLEYVSWQQVVWLLAAICGVLVLFFIGLLRDSPTERVITHHPQLRSWWHSLALVLGRPQTWGIGLYVFLIWSPMAVFAVLWGIPFFHASYHFSNSEAALLLSMAWVGVALGGPFFGWWSNYIQRRCVPMWVGALLGMLATSLIVYDVGLPTWVLALLLVVMGVASSAQVVSFGVVFDRQPGHLLGTAVGFNNMCCVLGGFILQPLVGYLLVRYMGPVASSTPVYTTAAYQHALWLLPLSYMGAAIVGMAVVKETRCQSMQ